jgi:hypothetical protein
MVSLYINIYAMHINSNIQRKMYTLKCIYYILNRKQESLKLNKLNIQEAEIKTKLSKEYRH